MKQFTSITLSIAMQLLITKSIIAGLDFEHLSKEIHLDEDFQHDFEGFKTFGHKTHALLKRFEEKPIALSLSLNANLENTFEHNLISPNIPEVLPPIKSTIRYTNTPLDTYEVTEDVYEPKPIPQLSVAKPILGGKAPLILGSGSLGVVNLGNGKYALGSGSLGYSRPVDNNRLQHNKQEAVGGLHVVPAPQLGSSEAFDAAFNNFDFKPLNSFFDHK